MNPRRLFNLRHIILLNSTQKVVSRGSKRLQSMSSRSPAATMKRQREGHLERTANEPRDSTLLETRLSRVEQVNERIRLFRLELQSGPAKFLAGQWLDMYVPGIDKAGGFTITSPPSSASAPSSNEKRDEPPYLELAVQESPQNSHAAWLWRPPIDILGSIIRVRIGGSFVFPPQRTLEGTKRVVFVAGGVGINPLMSMLSYLGETQNESLEVIVLYASKMPAGGLGDIVFLERIAALFGEKKLRGQLKLYITPGSNGDSATTVVRERLDQIHGADVHIRPRRLGIPDLREAVGERDHSASLVYVCGPPTMTDELVKTLTDPGGLGIDTGRVMTEKWW